MPPVVIDLSIAVLVFLMTYALASEGAWGATLMFFNALFAGLVAFNFYEPLAALLAENASFLAGLADTICLLGLFCVTLVVLRVTTDSIAPTMVRLPMPLYHLGRWFFGLAASCVTVAIILLAFETAPVHKQVFGVIGYDYKPPFGQGLDRRWLAFFQYSTGQTFARYGTAESDPAQQYGDAKVFDPRGKWLIIHQNARPYGEETVPAPEGAPAEGGAPAQGGGEVAGGGAPPPGQPGPGIPGGTAGAAVGLAPTTP